MKASTIISIIALASSLGAGIFAMKASNKASEAEMNALVDARLAARELKFVQAYAPHLRELFVSMNEPEYGADWNPKTMEELFAPAVKVVSGMTADPKETPGESGRREVLTPAPHTTGHTDP